MAALVELHPGDVLLIRRAADASPLEDDTRAAMIEIVEMCELEPGDALTALSDDLLTEVGLQRIPEPCDHLSATGIDQADGPEKIWRCDGCGFLYRERDDGNGRILGRDPV